MSFSWKGLVKTVAPIIGTALGGPLAGIATRFLSNHFLGEDDASEADLAAALSNAKPEDLRKLKKLDQAFQLEMKRLDIDVLELSRADRDSARKREMVVKDSIPAVLSIFLTLGFFSVLGILMFYKIEPSIKDVVQVMLGSLGTAWISAITYYFGSSHGSQIKSYLMKSS